MMVPVSARAAFIRPALPTRFLLVWEPATASSPRSCDGPFEAKSAIFEADNALVFLGEGLPFRIGVVSQRGDWLTLHDGSRVHVEPSADSVGRDG